MLANNNDEQPSFDAKSEEEQNMVEEVVQHASPAFAGGRKIELPEITVQKKSEVVKE